jgi:transcriptional regulator with GAF, ATPase, and Fis domain
VRELKNIIERAAYRDTTNEITPEDIGMLPSSGEAVGATVAVAVAAVTAAGGSFKERVEAVEKKLIVSALEKAEGNKAEAARLLGLSYHQFRYYHQKYA